MSNQETKRQHFVPKVYLKKFAKKDGKTFLIDSVRKDNPIDHFTANVDDICVKNDLYTLTGGTEKERQVIEDFYQNIEAKYNTVYEKLIDKKIREIADYEKQVIIAFITTLLFRNLAWVEKYNEFVERAFKKAYQMCKHHGKFSFNYLGKEISFKNQKFDNVLSEHLASIREDQVLIQVDVALKLSRLRSQDQFLVSELGEEDSNFVTSDNPVVIQSDNKGLIMPFDPENILSLPLNNKYLLYLMPSSIYPFKSDTNFIARDCKRKILCKTEELSANFLQIRNSNRFLLGEKKFIDKALKQKNSNDSIKNYKKPNNLRDLFKMAKEFGLID